MIELLRPAIADAAALAALKATLFIETFGPDNDPAQIAAHTERAFAVEEIARQLADPDIATFWLVEDGEPMGYLRLNFGAAQTEAGHDGSVEIEQIYVLAAHHGRGLGARLLRQAMAEGREREASWLWLSVWERNERAIEFYRRHGFEAFGEHTFMLGTEAQRDLLLRLDL